MKQEYKRYPADRRTERANGIALPFNKAAYGRRYNAHYASGSSSSTGLFVQTYSTEEQAVYNLINLVLTRKGERIMQPEFGSEVPEFVFRQNVEEERFSLSESLRADIAVWLPYLIISEVTVLPGNGTTPGDPLHAVTILISVKVTENGANIVITFRGASNGFEFDITR